ncbi:caspase-8-like [Colossoma macropomum]|uniref:caspase-8-like n=1 Tax=Colossoma macropomum TaxID=42526 RepID=UPI00186531F6|nr:caspase-8-like [Colossoma macropomum]XP_036425754.1 caspase-8-like [Colossoma macropomum]
MEIVRQHKTTLIKILSGDAKFVLQHVHQARLITEHEYGNLKDDISHHSRQDFTINLLDKMMHKGDKQCHKFLELLELNEMQETFPLLNDLLMPPSVRQGVPEINEYKMSSSPRGVCVIINNIYFDRRGRLMERRGSKVDVESLDEVFKWLGFTVEIHTDKTAVEMKEILMELSQRQHNGDCFICCILSHECDGGFCGTDGQIVHPSDILQPFGRANCQSLADKPKVFILHTGWEQPKYAIPDSDFLLALATIPGLHSYRHVVKGSWFIQSLCKMLKEGCKRREDVLTILNQVIVEVSAFETNPSVESNLSSRMSFRQIPHIDLTLKKRLVFHVPSN